MLLWVVSNYLQHIFVLRSNWIKVAVVLVCALVIWDMRFITLLSICIHSHDPNDRSHIPSILNIVCWMIALGIPESYPNFTLVEVKWIVLCLVIILIFVHRDCLSVDILDVMGLRDCIDQSYGCDEQ